MCAFLSCYTWLSNNNTFFDLIEEQNPLFHQVGSGHYEDGDGESDGGGGGQILSKGVWI